MKGGYEQDDGGDDEKSAKSKNYYRILKSVDVSGDEKKVQNIITNVFQNLAMKVVIESEAIEDSDVAVFIEELRNIPNLHFEK